MSQDAPGDVLSAECRRAIDAFLFPAPLQTLSGNPTDHTESSDAMWFMEESRPSLPPYAVFLERIFDYPSFEVALAYRLLSACRQAVHESCMQVLVLPSTMNATKSMGDTSASVAASVSAPPTEPAVENGTAFLQLEHRHARLEVLVARFQRLWDTLLPSTDELALWHNEMLAACASSNPFGFPADTPTSLFQHAASVDEPSAANGLQQAERDVDKVMRSRLLQALLRFQHGHFQHSIVANLTKFTAERVGEEGSAVGLDGALYHGSMPEAQRLWQALNTIGRQFQHWVSVALSCMQSKRAERHLWIQLFERGSFDDSLFLSPLIDDDSGDEIEAIRFDRIALARTATTRLQMTRLAALVGTCRALDPTEAEAALKKIQFEQDRRQSVREFSASTTAATASRRSMINFSVPDDTSALCVSVAGEGSVANRSMPVPLSLSRRSSSDENSTTPGSVPVAPLPAFTATDAMSPSAGRGGGRRASAVASNGPKSMHRSIVPQTTLVDLEMIVRAYHLDVPECTVPTGPFEDRLTEAALANGEDSAAAAAAQILAEQRLQMLLRIQRRRKTLVDSDDAVRMKKLFAANQRDFGMSTEACAVVTRHDASAQTLLCGVVHADSSFRDLEMELETTRRSLSEKTQCLMLERHRTDALITQLEKMQRLRQEHARKSAAAGGGGLKASQNDAPPKDGSPLLTTTADEADAVSSYFVVGDDIQESAFDKLLKSALLSASRMLDRSGVERHPSPHRGPSSPRPDSPARSVAVDQKPQGPVLKTLSLNGRLTPLQEPISQNAAIQSVIPARGAHSIEEHESDVPVAPQRRPVHADGGRSLERQFGKPFAKTLKSLKSHENKLLEIHMNRDVWTGVTSVQRVIVPSGIDPRHARTVLDEDAQRQEHQHQSKSGKVAAVHAQVRASTAPLESTPVSGGTRLTLKQTHYGTVSRV